jgi:NodT family efflux transporter outer membrane factor (OMF) lipoprotein
MIGGCTTSAITTAASSPAFPESFAQGGSDGKVSANWLREFDELKLNAMVSEAVEKNYALEQERARLAQAEQTVVIARANRFPELDLSLSGSRRGFDDSNGTRITANSFDAGLDVSMEVDLWGRLSRVQQAAQLDYAAQQARVTAAERDLAIATAAGVFRVMEAQQLLQVAQRRQDNARESHDIVASGYRQGLNDALDLYLARNELERQQANLSQQRQLLTETVADLQLALARYPDGKLRIDGDLPLLSEPIPVGLPSDLLARRPDLQEAWLQLLSSDAELAAAHKARFPSLALVGSGGVATAEFSDLLDIDGASWSLLAGLSQPLFDGGRLSALEVQSAARVRESEQQYLSLVYGAFAEVENSIARSSSLTERYDAFQEAEKNARAALDLALEQYQRGLVTYTTVLESQRQAFDAEVTVVQLRNLLLQNRLTLYGALGGEFSVAN